MKNVLVLASHNPRKRRELEALLEGLPISIRTLDDYPEVPEPEEDGATFVENAEKKALFVTARTGLPSLADDSGLEVDALGGAPGIRSARYAGAQKRSERDAANNRKLLEQLRAVPPPQRTARFTCCVALAAPDPSGHPAVVSQAEGTVEGVILDQPHGSGGFGYDPLFYHPPSGRTFAELPPEEKNRISHRARALAVIRPALLGWFGRADEPGNSDSGSR